jgi:hypothetical protein
MKKTPNAVVLLPITRTSSEAQANWRKILEILGKSDVSSLIILDKTPNEEASTYFSESFKFEDLNLYIIRRPPTEPIYDSQGFVSIDSGLWIIQLHDDDVWDGTLNIPNDAEELEMFTTRFYLNSKDLVSETSWEKSPPARINFTLLPHRIWNQFSQMISDQGGHVAGSVDSTLDFVARASCKVSHLSSFTYVYNNRHWEKRLEASNNLAVLAAEDGWSFMSSVDIQLLNRSIDRITAIEYFAPHLPSETIDACRAESFNLLSLSSKRRHLISIRLQLQMCTLLLSSVLKIVTIGDVSSTVRDRIKRKILTYNFVLKSCESKDKEELRTHIRHLREKNLIPRLEKRFIFWEELLSTKNLKS